MVYGVLMILRQINIANGTYHYSDHDVNKINKTFGMKWETTDFNRSSTESSKIKPNVPQMSDAEVEAKLHYNWNIFIDKLKTLPYTKVMYYKGHVTIDGKGDYNNKEFYLYADLGYGDFNKYVPSVNTLYLLEVNYICYVLKRYKD